MLQRLITIALACVALFAAPRGAFAQATSVVFNWSDRETAVNAHVQLGIDVINGENIKDPVLPTVDGLQFRLLGRNQSDQTTIVGGKAEHQRTITLVVDVHATKAGKLVVPAIEISVDGKTYKSESTALIVRSDQPDDGVDPLFVDVVGDPPSPLVGQRMTLTLRIWVRPYRAPDKNVKFGEADMWNQVDTERSKFGIFKKTIEDLARRGRFPVGRRELRNDREYYVYLIQTSYRATRAGPPELGEIEIQLAWPTVVRVGRNVFGQNRAQVTGVEKVVAVPSAVSGEIQALPDVGKPEFFNGAVGRFVVSASAKPTQVSVGDPITVTYIVTSQSADDATTLEELQAPPFSAMPELTKSFRIPSDPVAGKVSDRHKVFTQTFRPVTDDVKEIPAIPFAFFDPLRSEYSVASTKPISITVAATERLNLSQIVGGDTNTVERPDQRLTTVAGGLLANVPPTSALLANERLSFGPTLAIIAVAPPLACAALALVIAARRKRDADPLGRRSGRAARTALSALTSKAQPEDILAALAGFVADRCGLPDGTRTRSDAIEALRAQGVDEELITRTDRMMALCERARYAPKGGEGASVDEAREIVRQLDRSGLKMKGGAR